MLPSETLAGRLDDFILGRRGYWRDLYTILPKRVALLRNGGAGNQKPAAAELREALGRCGESLRKKIAQEACLDTENPNDALEAVRGLGRLCASLSPPSPFVRQRRKTPAWRRCANPGSYSLKPGSLGGAAKNRMRKPGGDRLRPATAQVASRRYRQYAVDCFRPRSRVCLPALGGFQAAVAFSVSTPVLLLIPKKKITTSKWSCSSNSTNIPT